MVERVHECFLQNIFGFSIVVQNPQANVVHRLGILLVEVILRLSLALLAAFDQVSMTVWVRRPDRFAVAISV
jgi:hypothetical protein